MTTNEVRLAAERLSAWKNHGLGVRDHVYYSDKDLKRQDTYHLALAYLAENDPAPIHRDWLVSLGGIAIGPGAVQFERADSLPIRLNILGDAWSVRLVIDPGRSNANVRVANPIGNRGEFRRLAACLGIDLKEQG